MTKLPAAYADLESETGPMILLEALKLYGTAEVKGAGNNPVILKWADEVALKVKTAYANWADDFYAQDSIPWCGAYLAVVACRASQDRPERFPPTKYLSALEWASYGLPAPLTGAMLGDILVFKREGGGHVGLYVGEDDQAFHVLGGNQSDAVTITRILKSRCVAVRRSPYRVQPANVRKIFRSNTGAVSTNES